MARSPRQFCALALEDGTVFEGQSYGATGTAVGEIVFNTALSGYQEILTDPSYRGQIVAMTAPLIGNYGVNVEDVESARLWLSGFVVKEPSRRVSNQRATGDLSGLLREAGVVGISHVDTRALTRRLRVEGAMRGIISTEERDPAVLVAQARASQGMVGRDLVADTAPKVERVWRESTSADWRGIGDGNTCHETQAMESSSMPATRIVAIDCGIKHNILRLLADFGADVIVVPPAMPAEAMLERRPHGILVGNGPGDPAAATGVIATLKSLIGRVPIFGICLGHQLLALALGATTYKLRFGHHGANHPVMNVDTGRVEITSQNHGFAVDETSLARVGGRSTHVNLYDRSLEGFEHAVHGLFAVQYHPESAPGPHDSRYLFERFFSQFVAARSAPAVG